MKDKLEEEEDIPSLGTLIEVNNKKHIISVENSSHIKNRSELEKHLKNVTRNKEWFDATATKLNVLVQQLDVLKKHSHHKVRKELVENIHLLLTTCSR